MPLKMKGGLSDVLPNHGFKSNLSALSPWTGSQKLPLLVAWETAILKDKPWLLSIFYVLWTVVCKN